MRLEIGILLPSYVQEEEFIIVLELIKEENFIQLCEYTCIVRAVFMSLSFNGEVMSIVCGKMYSIGHSLMFRFHHLFVFLESIMKEKFLVLILLLHCLGLKYQLGI